MARSGARRSRTQAAGSSPPSPPDPRGDADRIIDAAVVRIAAEGWRRLSLAGIAVEAGLPILRVYRCFPSKQAVLCGLFRRIDEAALADLPVAEADERPRDRLFDLLMRRYDALRPYKSAIAALRRELAGDPLTALGAGARMVRSMRWMLDGADIVTDGWRGILAVKLTAAAYLSTMRVWQGDDSPDVARTMAALDARLRRIERWLVPLDSPPARGGSILA